MFAAWTVGINLITRSNFGMVAGNIARQSAVANGQVTALSRRMNGLKQSGAIATNAMIGVGVAAGAAFAVGVRGAAELQDSIAQLAVSTGRTTQSIDKQFTGVAMSMSRSTAQTISQSMKLVQVMSTSIKDQHQLEQIAMPIALFADTQFLGPHKIPFEESAKEASRLAHMFNAYTAKQMDPVLDMLYRTSYSTPDKIGAITTQLGYFGHDMYSAMVKNNATPEKQKHAAQEILSLATLGDIAIGHGKWGAGLDRILTDIAAPTKPHRAGQIALGLRDAQGKLTSDVVNKDGEYTPVEMLKFLSKRLENVAPLDVRTMLSHAFGVNSTRTISQMISPRMIRLFEQLQQAQARMVPLQQAQHDLMQTLNHQTVLLFSNFGTLAAMLVRPWMDHFTAAVGRAADALGRMAQWSSKHPGESKVISGAMMGLGALAIGLALKKGFGVAAHLGHAMGLPRGAGFSIFRHVGGYGGRHAAEEAASHSGSIARGIVDYITLKSLRTGAGKAGGKFLTHMPGFQVLGESLGKVAMMALKVGGPIKLVAEFLAKLGLRAIPLVGEVLLLVDVLKFMGSHVKDIGYYIGKAARWIHDNGWGLIKSAFTYVLNGIADLIKFILNPMNLVHFIGGLGKAIGDGFSGHSDDNQHQYLANQHRIAAQAAKHPHKLNTGGRILGNGVAMLHSNEIVVKDRTVKNMDRYFAKGGGGGIAIHINAPYHAAPGNDAQSKRNALDHARQVANETARVISATMRTSMRSAGSTIATLGMSPLELNPSV